MDKNFHFISLGKNPSSDVEKQITEAEAQVTVTPTGNENPTSRHIGAIVSNDFEEIIQKLNVLKEQYKQINIIENRQIILSLVMLLILIEKSILESENTSIREAYNLLNNCTISFDNERKVRFDPCGHMICCEKCDEITFKSTQKTCQHCRRPIIGLQRIYL